MFSKRVDAAFPGPHTRLLYDPLPHQETRVLVQLWTGKARLNFYLVHIGAVGGVRMWVRRIRIMLMTARCLTSVSMGGCTSSATL